MTTWTDGLGAVLDDMDHEVCRTLAEVSDDPPPPLLLGMLEPTQNLLVAPPGTGKGTTGAYLVRELIAAGMRPLIYDAERREREWARRVGGLGVDRAAVRYMTPDDLPRQYRGVPLWEAADHLRREVVAHGVDALFVDSALPAVGLGEERIRSDPSVPWSYRDGLIAIGVRAVTFAHPPKGQPAGEPFGSYAWTAAHPMVWSGLQEPGEDAHRVRWRPRKANERGRVPAVLFTFHYLDGRLIAVDRADAEEATRDRLLAELAHGPRTVSDLVEAILEDEDDVDARLQTRTHERVRKALRRMARDGWVEAPPRGRHGGLWALRFRAP